MCMQCKHVKCKKKREQKNAMGQYKRGIDDTARNKLSFKSKRCDSLRIAHTENVTEDEPKTQMSRLQLNGKRCHVLCGTQWQSTTDAKRTTENACARGLKIVVESTTMVETWSAIKRNSKVVAGTGEKKEHTERPESRCNQFYCFIHWLIFSIRKFFFFYSTLISGEWHPFRFILIPFVHLIAILDCPSLWRVKIIACRNAICTKWCHAKSARKVRASFIQHNRFRRIRQFDARTVNRFAFYRAPFRFNWK